jgi:hypothetical protein
LDPISFIIGLLSPVSILSLQIPLPKTTIPSIGIYPPGNILIKSDTYTNSTSISSVAASKLSDLLSLAEDFFSKLALVTLREASWDNLSTVFFFEMVSRYFPNKIMVIKKELTMKLETKLITSVG